MDRPGIRKTARVVWLNNQLAIPPSVAVKEAFANFADPFSLLSFPVVKFLQETEEIVRALVTCPSVYEFHFVPQYAQATTMIVTALLEHLADFQGRNHLLIASHDQQHLVRALSRRQGLGATYDWVTVQKEGRIHPEQLLESLTPKTLLFSLSVANGMTGLIEPIQELGELCRERGVLFHLDLSDVLGRLALTSEMVRADVLTFSSSALGGMGTLGGMFISPKLAKQIALWFPQHMFLPSLAPIAAMKVACEERLAAFSSLVLSSASLRKKLVAQLKEIEGVQILFNQSTDRLPNVVVAAFPNVPAESLSFFLQHQGIYPGVGYERFQPLAQVLQHCGVSPFLCHSALHFSFTERTDASSFPTVISAIREGISHLCPITVSTL